MRTLSRSRFPALGATLLVSACATTGGSRGTSPVPVYVLRCDKSDPPLDVAVNGAHPASTSQTDGIVSLLNPVIWPGTNRIRLHAPAGIKAPGACKLLTGRSTDDLSSLRQVQACTWPAPGAGPGQPFDDRLEFQVIDPPPGELWSRAEPITLDDASRAAILDLVGSLCQAVSAKDKERVGALLRFGTAELARSFGEKPSEGAKAGEEAPAFVRDLDQSRVEPWNAERAEVTLEAGGRLAHVSVRGHAPLVIWKEYDRIGLELYVAKVSGAWTIARISPEVFPSAKPAGPFYTLTCQKVGLPFRVSVNGTEVERSDTVESSGSTQPLNPFLRPGGNLLRFRAPAQPRAQEGGRIDCSVMLNKPGDVVATGGDSEGKQLVRFVVTPDGKKVRLPIDQEVGLPADAMPETELWKSATRIRLDSRSRAAILKLTGELHEAYASGNAERISALEDFRVADRARAMGADPEVMRSASLLEVRDTVQQFKSATFEPWNPKKASVELVADGLLAHVTVNGKPPIVARRKEGEDVSTSQIEVYVAKVNGTWVVAR